MYFPATYSTLCPTALATLVGERYALEDVQCQLLVKGVGDTYLVSCNEQRYILRSYRSSHRSLPQIQEEVTLLLALQQAGVSVSYPIADAPGAVIQPIEAIEGMRYAVLFTYAAGHSVKVLSEAQLLAMGREAARLHNVSCGMGAGTLRWHFDTETTIFKPLQILHPAFKATAAYTWLCRAAAYAGNKLSGIDDTAFSKGYCHFDLLPKNFHFEEEKITFFDFDFMGHGWLVNDIMTFWQHLMLEAYAGRMTQGAANAAYATFLQGYREYRAISEQELALVPYLTLGFWLFYMGFHTSHDQFHNFCQPAYAEVYTGFLKHIAKEHWPAEAGL